VRDGRLVAGREYASRQEAIAAAERLRDGAEPRG
jgi:hypothetical protein